LPVVWKKNTLGWLMNPWPERFSIWANFTLFISLWFISPSDRPFQVICGGTSLPTHATKPDRGGYDRLEHLSHRRAETRRLHSFQWGKGARGEAVTKAAVGPESGFRPHKCTKILPYHSAFPVLKLSAAAVAATFEDTWPFHTTLRQRGVYQVGCRATVCKQL
jgi:hypothetical protein